MRRRASGTGALLLFDFFRVKWYVYRKKQLVIRGTAMAAERRSGSEPNTRRMSAAEGGSGRTEAGLVRRSLVFGGKWRSYQKRVLNHVQSYENDGRIHIVAAPGSGKTTLGIELIGRADEPCLILAPSITIREQWLSRMREDFGAPAELLSNDIRRPAPVTAITYQALYSCVRKRKNVEEDEEGRREETDYEAFDLNAALERMGIGVFCLDEAHHLRGEWQRALEEVTQAHADCLIISLTATPPYDSAPAQWNRYIGLCGPIDEEIGVPELVKEKSLCPHQDYVYFNMPTPEEEAELKKFRRESAKAYRQLMEDRAFAGAISRHGCMKEPGAYLKMFGENRIYLLALLSFLDEKQAEIPEELYELTDGALPEMDAKLMSVLLQGFLFDDAESYRCREGYQEALADSLRSRGLIHKNRVELYASSRIQKMLINSRGKLKSIRKIVELEYGNLGEDLRLLVLTDFIRSEYLQAIGDDAGPIREMGVVPIFEYLRRGGEPEESGETPDARGPRRNAAGAQAEARQDADRTQSNARGPRPDMRGLRLAALSGSVVILPEEAREAFLDMAEENRQQARLEACQAPGYYIAYLSGNGPRLTAYLTELFRLGYIRVLVGTRSLLGEGWDSPCVNTLVLASFVGSFMLSNQMRGRAIRAVKGDPDKVSNIWHLICMEPLWNENRDGEKDGRAAEACSEDFATLRRRFENFLGLNYEEDLIENGLDRLTCVRPPYGRRRLEEINGEMAALAADRGRLQKRWERTLASMEEMETVDGVGLAAERLTVQRQRKKYRRRANAGRGGFIVAAGAGAALAAVGQWIFSGIAFAAAVVSFVYMLAVRRRQDIYESPELFIGAVGGAILTALRQTGQVTTGKAVVGVENREEEQDACYACLQGGTEREKHIFADALAEFLGGVEDPRYLLRMSDPGPEDRFFYAVPEVFGGNREDARLFADLMASCIGECDLIFTRNQEGRRALLEAGLADSGADGGGPVRHKQVQER